MRFTTLRAGEQVRSRHVTELQDAAHRRGLDIRLRGAVGDGATDDTAAFLATLNDLPSTGGAIFVPEGTYLVNTDLTRALDNVTIQGVGESSIIQTTSTTASIITPGGDHWRIRDLKLVGHASATTGAAILANGKDDLIIEGVHTHLGWIGFYLATCTRSKIHDCLATNAIRYGYDLTTTCTDCLVSDCHSDTHGRTGFIIGPTCLRCSIEHSVSVNGTLAVNGFAGGFQINDASWCVVKGCIAYNNNGEGILIDSATAAEYNLIEGNLVYEQQFPEPLDPDAAEGITLYQPTTAYNTVRGNVCVDNPLNQIEIYDTGGYNIVEGNYCSGSSAGAAGIALVGGVAPFATVNNLHNVVKDNVCRLNQDSGILVSGSGGQVIEGNQCIDNCQSGSGTAARQNGIHCADTAGGVSTGLIIANNICKNVDGVTQQVGIRLENTAEGLITGNRVSGNAVAAIADNVGTSVRYGNAGDEQERNMPVLRLQGWVKWDDAHTGGFHRVTLGAAPAGWFLSSVRLDVTTAFNATGTDLVSVGQGDGAQQSYMVQTSVAAAGPIFAPTLGTEVGYHAAASAVYAYYNSDDETNLTQGAVMITVELCKVTTP